LLAWKYGDKPGALPLIFGIDMETLTYVEIPLKSVRKIDIGRRNTTNCSGNPTHAFIDIPGSWKFCPLCGSTLKRTP
jgi:hypothetical protein